jgi:hypothetical protein
VYLKLLIAAGLLAVSTVVPVVAPMIAPLVVTPAMAQALCTEPAMPMPVDGTAATADQMRTTMAEARDYIAQSGLYQECLQKEADSVKSQVSAAGQPMEPILEARNKIDASKKAQERVSLTVDNALAAYKNAHPR